MEREQKTVIVTGASQGIGAGVARAFLARGYNVVGTSRSATKSKELTASAHLALVDGDIGQFETAQHVADAALRKFGSIDAVVANAGIFSVKRFTDYTPEDLRAFVSTNLAGFVYVTQVAVRQMQQQAGGSVVSITTAALVDNPIAGVPASIPMITKGGLQAVSWCSLASEYAAEQYLIQCRGSLEPSTPRFTSRIRESSSKRCRRWAPFPRSMTSQARSFTSRKLAGSPGRSCMSTAALTTGDGDGEFPVRRC